jgi:hypothetical protein
MTTYEIIAIGITIALYGIYAYLLWSLINGLKNDK